MKVEFLDPAENEFIRAIGHYNGESEGLGYEFAAEVNRTIGPHHGIPECVGAAIETDSSVSDEPVPLWCDLPVRSDTILIVAVMHLHRDPESWKDRLSPGER
jgi:hypothetical protein